MPFPPSSLRTRVLVALAMLAGWGLLFGPSLLAHVETGSDPLVFNDDVRQWTWPLFRLHAPALFADDYIADYFLDALMPVGHKALYAATGLVGDAAVVSKVLPYLLLGVVVAGVAAAGRALGGYAVAFGAGLSLIHI